MSDNSLLPEFHVCLAFVDKEGNEIPKEEFQKPEYEGGGFFQKWADGDIRRDVVVHPGDCITSSDLHAAVTDRLFGSPRSAMAVADNFADKVSFLLTQLALSTHLLAFKTLDDDTQPAIISLNEGAMEHVELPQPWDGAMFDPSTKRSGMERKKPKRALYPCLYPNDSEQAGVFLVEKLEASKDNFTEFLRDHFRKVLSRLLTKDNEVVLQLLRTAAAAQGDSTLAVKELTAAAFAQSRDMLWRWAYPVSSIVADASTLAGISDDTLVSAIKWRDVSVDPQSILRGDVGRFAGVFTLCLGSPHDPLQVSSVEKELFLCSLPSRVGIRGVREQLTGHPVDRRILGESSVGVYYLEQIYTVVANSKSVSRLVLLD